MPKEDVITLVDVLDDGTAVIETNELAGPNHVSAHDLLKAFTSALGGACRIAKRLAKRKKSHNSHSQHH